MFIFAAIILGSPLLRHYLINYARPLIYTTFMPYPNLVAIHASYGLLSSGHTVKVGYVHLLDHACADTIVASRKPARAHSTSFYRAALHKHIGARR
jgi:hypothetical protein